MEKVKFAPKDAKIIKDNPGRSPYELMDLGLSNAAFDKLMNQQTTDIQPVADSELEETQPEEQQKNEQGEQSSVIQPSAAPEPSLPIVDVKPNDTKPQDALIPKLTGVVAPAKPPVVKRTEGLLPGQVLIETPDGRRNSMSREFAKKLVKQDPRYKIIS